MIDLYLRAADEAAAQAALPRFVLTDPEGARHWCLAEADFALDPVGRLEGAPGWHLNLRLWDEGVALATAVEASGLVIPSPDTPQRIWQR